MPVVTARTTALIVLLLAAMVLGLAPILVRLSDTGPAAAAFWRFAFAMPLLLVLSQRRGGEGIGLPGRWMALAALFFVLDLGFWHYGIVMTSVANATVLCNLTPVVVTLFAWVVLRERPRWLFLVALGLAMAGALAMAVGARAGQGSSPMLGDIFSLSVALWYAGYFLAVKAARRTAGAIRVLLWSTGMGLPVLLLLALALGESILPSSPAGWAACVGLGVLHVVGQGGVAWALGRLPAAITAVTILIQPLVATLLGWLIFAETMTPVQMLGGVGILAAVLLAQWSARTARPDRGPMKTGAEPESPAPV
tara:strand:+ start:4514 stop:5440 length:927 start_codon:yes stop_codon:yes gene_type:complete